MGQVKNNLAAPNSDYELIETSDALDQFIHKVGKAEIIAVDIEGDSMFHYQEKVCLIQIAVNGYTCVIDPLKIKDLSALKPLLENPEITKVIHGADYDVRSMYRDFGFTINNLFDTQLAGMYMGWAETSLEAVVARHFGVELNKKYQKKNWSRRPLPEDMVAYAASDVTYLIPIARHLTEELKQKGRLEWVREQCLLLSSVRPQNNDGSNPMFMKFKGAGRLEPRSLAVLEALLQMRNAIARQKDRPLFKIISNTALKKIAIAIPANLKQLKAGKALSEKQIDMYGKAVMEAVRNARNIPKNQLPTYPRTRSPRVPRQVPARIKSLQEWRDQEAERLGLNGSLLLNRTLIKSIALANPADRETLSQVEGIHHWQVETYGDSIINALQ